MPTTPNILIEIATRHQVHLERLKSGAQAEFDKFLRDMQRDIVAQLSQVEDLDSLRGRRLNRLLKAVRETLQAGFGDYEAVWRQQLADLAEYEGGFEVRNLQRVFGVDFSLPSPAQMVTAAFAKPLSVQGIDQGSLLQSFFDGWTDKTRRRVEGSIRLSAAQGESLTQAIRRLRGTRARNYRDGLFHASRRDMAMLVRTSMQHVAVQAKEAVWTSNKDIIKGVEWASVLDGRTSTICRSLDGQVFPVDKGPRPPAHIACRSVTVPRVKDSLSILGKNGQQTARGADGIEQVPANQDYYSWLKTQPAKFQDSVIGAERGKLLREGGLSAERFRALQLDRNFRPLTLDQMRELEPAAFAKAFGSPSGGSSGGNSGGSAPQRRVFKYKSFKAPKGYEAVNSFIRDNGIADRSDMKGVSAVTQSPESLQAMQEVTERYGLAPLGSIGPVSRFYRARTRGANAAIYSSARLPDAENVGHFHTPTKFGNINDRTKQHELGLRTAPKYQKERDGILERGEWLSLSGKTKLDPDAVEAAKRLGEGYGWSTSTMADPVRASVITTYHEYGHVIHRIDKRIGAKIDEFLVSEQPLQKGWALPLSKYAQHNSKELVAESFAVYMDDASQHWRIHPKLLAIFKEFDLAND